MNSLLGLIALSEGKSDAAKHHFRESLAMARSESDRVASAVPLLILGFIALMRRDYDRAAALATESLLIFREIASMAEAAG